MIVSLRQVIERSLIMMGRPRMPRLVGGSALLACFLVAFPLRRAHGDTGAVDPVDEFSSELDAYSLKLQSLPPPAPGCRNAYPAALTKAPLTIGVFFGFINTSRKNYVADGDFKQALIRRLTKPCRQNEQACGFVPGGADPSFPNKTALTKSLDGRKVAISVYDSSVSREYSACVGRLSEEQEQRSRLATEEYLSALRQDAVVFYSGHSRYGAGSGFYPPLSLRKIGLAAIVRPPLFTRICETLESSASTPAILGMFSCHSREYYAGRLHALAPRTALLVSSGAASHEDSLMSVLGGLNLVLSRPCFGEAEDSINSDGKAPVFRLYGVFDRLPHPHYTRYHNALYAVMALLFLPFLMVLVSRWSKTGASSWPAAAPDRARTGAAVLFLSLSPSVVLARALSAQISSPLPFLLTFTGLLLLAISMGRRRISAGRITGIAKEALPFLLVPLFLYFFLSLIREISVENALSASRQSLKLALIFYLILPFVLLSEEILFVPYLRKDGADAVPSFVASLFFYVAVWLVLCWLAPVFKPALWPVLVALLFNRTFSFLLYRWKPDVLIPVFFQAVTLALVFTEGIHDQLYR
jgi:hypothetical protein